MNFTVGKIISTAEQIAEKWNKSGICYGVTHGLEYYPNSIGRDLDVIVRSDQKEVALIIAVSILKRENWDVAVHRKPWAYWIFAFKRDVNGVYFLEVDLFDHLLWASKSLAKVTGCIYQKGPFKIEPWAGFVKKILIQILGGNIERLKQRIQEVRIDSSERKVIEEWLTTTLGKILANELLQAIEDSDIDRLTALAPVLRRSLLFNSFVKQKLSVTVTTILEWARNDISQFLAQSCAPIITVVGPDGVGKSTLLRKVHLKNTFFMQPVVRHWRPGVLPRLGRLVGTPDVAPDDKGMLIPRRKPGKFYPIRLLYYATDFLLGRYLKDNPDSSRLRPVLYDRCLLDAYVDPLRYGFSSNRGIKILWKLLPKPDLVVLLYDFPERIHTRKPELPVGEIERQLKEWLKLAQEGYVDVILPVDAPPDEMAQRLEELIIEAFIEKHRNGTNRILYSQERNLQWLSKATGCNIKMDAGASATHAYLHLPDGRGYLLPITNEKAFQKSLTLYPAQGKKARVLKKVMATISRLGIKAPGLHRVRLEEKDDTVFQTLRKIFNREDLTFAISLGTPSPHRKPVVQVMTSEGKVLGYAKVGWNEETKRLVEHEAQVLRTLAGENLPFSVPQVLYTNEEGGRSLCVQTPPPEPVQPAPRKLEPAYLEVLETLASRNLRWLSLEESSFWKRLRQRKVRVCSSYWRCFLEQAMEKTADCWKGREVPFHPAHGDFAPWNAFCADGVLYLYDWEYALEEVPAGYDLFHFLVQVAWFVERKAPGAIMESILKFCKDEALRTYMRTCVSTWDELKLLFSLYLLDQIVSSCVEGNGIKKIQAILLLAIQQIMN